jgi:hypothetical protein
MIDESDEGTLEKVKYEEYDMKEEESGESSLDKAEDSARNTYNMRIG